MIALNIVPPPLVVVLPCVSLPLMQGFFIYPSCNVITAP